jgi:hypothetical protein
MLAGDQIQISFRRSIKVVFLIAIGAARGLVAVQGKTAKRATEVHEYSG